MKDIIYLNNDYINSFISQAYDGLPIQKQSEISNGNTEEGTDSSSEKSAGGVKAGISPLNAKYKYETSEVSSLTTSQSDETKEIVAKKIYDNALNDLEKLLLEKGKLKSDFDTAKFGDYVKIRHSLQIHDVRDFLRVTSTETIVAYKAALDQNVENLTKSQQVEYDSAPAENKGTLKSNHRLALNKLKKRNEEEIQAMTNLFSTIAKYFVLIEKFLPTSIFLKTTNCVIPIEEKFLRESVASLNFKYSNNSLENKVVILGKVTKKAANTKILDEGLLKSLELKNLFSAMNDVIDEYFKLINVINENDFVISPIAVYYEDDLF